MRRLGLIVALVLAANACDSDDDTQSDVSGDLPPDDPKDDPTDDPKPGTFAAFVIDLVTNKTANNTDPVASATFESLPDPDANNENAFSSLFQ